MNKKNGIFSVSVILSLLMSLVAAIIVWLFAKYDILTGSAVAAPFADLIRFCPRI